MKKTILTALAALSLIFTAKAQNINGKVIGEDGAPVEFATVALYTLPDSTLVAGSVADIDGLFEIEGNGDILQVSMIGYKTKSIETKTFANGSAIKLQGDSKVLEEAVVSAVLPKTELKGNAVVTNVAGSVLEHSGNALDVLGKIPGMISKDGGLEVIGRGAPLYYINGRKVTDNSELRDLMSEDIKSIDVISNPGSAYGGEVHCVVRIHTVRHQGDGFSFALTSQAKQRIYDCRDFDPSWTVLDLNYRKKGLDIFGKFVFWQQHGYQISNVDGGTFVRKDGGILSNFQKGILDYRADEGGLQYTAGLNWQVNDNHSLGFKLDFSDLTRANNKMMMDEDVITNGVVIDHLVAHNDAKSMLNKQLSGNLYYDGNIDKLNVNFNADFVTSRFGNEMSVSETSWSAPVEMVSVNNRQTSMGAGKLILSHPVWKGVLQAGVEEIYVSSKETYSITKAEIPSSNTSFSENTIAGFAEYALAFEAVQLSAGLRFEHANFDYIDKLDGSKNLTRIHNNWFPSFSASAKAGPVSFNLSYSGKTMRPSYGLLSNEITYDNRFSYQQGDPTLKNEIHRTFSLNVNWKWLTFSGGYERIDNCIYQKAYPYNDEGVVMIRWANVDDPVRKMTFYLNASPTIGIWYPRITTGMEQQFFSTILPDPREAEGKRRFTNDAPMFFFQINNSFKFKHNWVIDADYQYITPYCDLVMTSTRPRHVAALAVSKSFLKNDALNVRLSWDDIFNCSIDYYEADYGNCVVSQTNNRYNPCVQLRVSYRFNTANSKYKGTGAGQDAKNRM